jgi:hypothetical protein
MAHFLDVKKNCFYVLFYAYVKLFHILREEYGMTVFQNRMVRRIFGANYGKYYVDG